MELETTTIDCPIFPELARAGADIQCAIPSSRRRQKSFRRHKLMKQTPLKFLCILAAMAGFSLVATGQDESYDADPVPEYDPLKTDLPAGTRVIKDIQKIAEIAGDTLGDQLSPLLTDAFDGEVSDDDRLAALGDLESLLASIDRSDQNQNAVYRKVSRRTRLAKSLVSALKATNADDKAREITNDLLIRSTVYYENGNRVAQTEVARRRYHQLKVSYPAIYQAVRSTYNSDYFNYNLHLVVSESLIQKLVSDIRCESGPVKDCILGAYVTGTQVTNTELRADVRPSTNSANFELLVSGTTSSNTSGTKSPAVIYTRGNHSFDINKSVYFDGQRISSGKANMNVNANNQTVGVSTKYDKIPLLGRFARKIAFSEAQKLKGKSEAIAARKLADQAIPRFDREVNAKFAEANSNLESNLLQSLRNRGIAPESYSARSSESHIAVSSRTIRTATLAANNPPGIPVTANGVSVQIHESAMNAGIDSLQLSGRMTIDEVLSKVEQALSEFARKPVSVRANTASIDRDTDFDFDPADPIRVRLEEGRVVLLLRTGFYQIEKDRRIPRHSFEVPVEIQLQDNQLLLIAPNTESKNIAKVIKPRSIEERASPRSIIQARAIAQKLIEGAFKEEVKVLNTNVDVKLGGGQNLAMSLSYFQISDGWISLVLE